MTTVHGSRVHFLKRTVTLKLPSTPGPLRPFPFSRATFLSSSARSFTHTELSFLEPSLTASLIRQMQSVGRPSPLAAKQPPLISARVYRIST